MLRFRIKKYSKGNRYYSSRTDIYTVIIKGDSYNIKNVDACVLDSLEFCRLATLFKPISGQNNNAQYVVPIIPIKQF